MLGDTPEHVWAADPRTRSILAALLPGVNLAEPAAGCPAVSRAGSRWPPC